MIDTRTLYIETRDVIAKAESLGYIKTFIKAVREAGLERELKGVGPFTVFAPDDGAFYRMPAAAVRDLFEDRPGLERFVKYHIVPNHRILRADVHTLQQAPTLEGGALGFTSRTVETFMVNDIVVIEADIECSNGVIHIIDSLLSPRHPGL